MFWALPCISRLNKFGREVISIIFLLSRNEKTSTTRTTPEVVNYQLKGEKKGNTRMTIPIS